MSGTFFSRDPKERRPFDSSLSFLVGVNAFLFGHGPMSPTLADVYMITGLDVSGSVYPWDFKGSTRQTGVKPGSGYKSYI
jgi:hypothetical protein